MNIIVDKTCRISPPYTPESVTQCSSSSDRSLYTSTVAQLQKMMVREMYMRAPPPVFFHNFVLRHCPRGAVSSPFLWAAHVALSLLSFPLSFSSLQAAAKLKAEGSP